MVDSFRTGGISLRELFPDAEFRGAGDIRVTSCCVDSRRCRAGDLFVAIEGDGADGHDFVREACSTGARAVLSNRPLSNANVPNCIVPCTRSAHSRLCQALAGNPSERLKVIGITGTNGKTTTSYLVASILDAAGYLTGILGTLGYYDGLDVETATLTTPGPPTLASWLARMEANGCDYGVMEVSSHALAQKRVAGITFNVACVTNIQHDHLDYHGTPENYAAAKMRIVDHLAPEGVAVVNADDEGSLGCLSRYDGPVLSIGVNSPAELTAAPLDEYLYEQTFLLSCGSDTIPVRTSLIGRHNIHNCLMAAAIGFACDIDLPTIVRGLESVKRIPGRLERIECGQPFGVFVDYAHTADALSECLSTLRPVTQGRLICVYGAGGDRDRLKRPRMGRSAELGADLTVITSDNPRFEDPDTIIGDIVAGLKNRSRARVMPDRNEAICWALSQAREGDCVLIAGKGHEAYQIVGHERLYFDDRELARQWLYDAGTSSEAFKATA